MKNIYFKVVILSSFCFFSCKEKADIKVIIFDPGMQQAITNTEVNLGEFEYKKAFLSNTYHWSLTNILQSKTTDNSGVAIFQKVKMKENSDFKYEIFCNKNSQMDTDLKSPVTKKKGAQTVHMFASTSGWLELWCYNLFNQYLNDDYLEIRHNGLIIVHVTKDNMPSGYTSRYFLGELNLPTGENTVTVIKKKLGVQTTFNQVFQIKHLQNDSLPLNW